jgi:hypothetical protein
VERKGMEGTGVAGKGKDWRGMEWIRFKKGKKK